MKIPKRFGDRIYHGLYGGVVQFFIKGVDGTCAQLGDKLPREEDLVEIIEQADKAHQKLMKEHNRK